MDRDPLVRPEQQFGYHHEEPTRADDQSGPTPTAGETEGRNNRGTRSPDEGSGGVVGSGAGAGGGGGPEDYDSDSVGGGGSVRYDPARPAADTGADASNHGSR